VALLRRVDSPVNTQWAENNGRPTRFFYQLILDLWRRTPEQHEVTADHTVTGEFNHEIVVCTNTVDITVTMPGLTEGLQVTVIRAGTGGVTVDGDGTNIIGAATQILGAQYDAPHMIGSSSEWLLT